MVYSHALQFLDLLTFVQVKSSRMAALYFVI